MNRRHKIDILKLQRQFVSASAKRKATDDICERPAKILHSIATVQDTSLIKISDVKYIKRNMYNARRNLLPPLPNTTQSVQEALKSMKYKSSKGEDMLLYNDFNSECVIICCKSNLEILCKSEILYVDDTFEYCAKHFLQLFSVHGYFNGHYIPLVFGLLKNKSTNFYIHFFQTLNEKCTENGYILKPKSIVI